MSVFLGVPGDLSIHSNQHVCIPIGKRQKAVGRDHSKSKSDAHQTGGLIHFGPMSSSWHGTKLEILETLEVPGCYLAGAISALESAKQ